MTTGGDVDRLSELSDDLLRRILYFLPSEEAARTSVLSRRWGSLWRSSGAVNLAVQVHGYEYLRRGRGFGVGFDYEDQTDYKEAEEAFFSKQAAFVRGAKAALDAAEVPITRLTLRVESNGHDGESTIRQFLGRSRNWDNIDVVGAVVSHQAARRVEELRVAAVDVSNYRFYSEEENNRHGQWQSGTMYGLASLPSESLRVLDLTRCDLMSALVAALPLPRLATLRLWFCSVELQVLQALLDAAPELTTVQLESVCFLDSQKTTQFHYELDGTATAEQLVLHLSFQATTTLVLALCGMKVQDSGDGRGGGRWAIEIDAPRLQSFKYKGLMRRFILRSAAPSIARVDLHFLRHDPDRYDSDRDNVKETTRMLFWQFLHNFTNARTLKLKVGNDLKDVAAIGEARRATLLCAFPRAERLELEGTHAPKSKTAAVAIANLLHCCPVLGEIVLKLSVATALRDKGSRYGHEFLERKDRSDYTKSMEQFVRRRKSKTIISTTEDSIFCDNKYNNVPRIPGLSGRSFACLQRTVRRVGLQFTLDNNSISSCLGLRLIKFFADHARVLEEMCIDTGNRKLYEHFNFNVETQMALAPIPISATASIKYKNLAERLSEFSRISSASLHSTTDLATPRVRRASTVSDDWFPRRSDRLAAKSAFRDPQPERQARRVLLNKFEGRQPGASSITPDTTIATRFRSHFGDSVPLSKKAVVQKIFPMHGRRLARAVDRL